MVKAYWNNKLIAESEKTIIVEGNHYFPPEKVKSEYLSKSSLQTHCPWKGDASYYSLEVNGETNKDAAWYYPEPSALASPIKNHISFWKGVKVIEE